MTLTGSPGIRRMSRKTTVTTTASTGTSVRSRRIRYAVTRYGEQASPHEDGARDLTLLLDPHVVEADALGLLVEALGRVADGAKPGEVAVADHRHFLVELTGL